MIQLGINYATFVPWILYFIEIMFYRIGVYEDKQSDKTKYISHMDKNMFSSINVKEIVLFIIFLLFMQHKSTLVLEILFPTMYIYLLIDFFQTLANQCKKINNKWLMVQTVILVSCIILYFMATHNLYTCYILMFSSSILSAFIIGLFGEISKLFKRK